MDNKENTKTDYIWSVDSEKRQDDEKENKKIENELVAIQSQLNCSDMALPKNLQELKYVISDIVAGDKKALDNPIYRNLNFDSIKKAINWLINEEQLSNIAKEDLSVNPWRLNFRNKPPTIQEFLTQKYIGPTATTLWKNVVDELVKFFDPINPYTTIVLNGCIGSGKSFCTVVSNLYVSTLYATMYAPYKFFGHSQPLDSKVYINENDFVYMNDIKVGDKVLTPDGSQAEVIEINDWEDDDVYEVEFENGEKVKAGKNHRWQVYYIKNGERVSDIVSTQFLVDHPEIDFEIPKYEKVK